jgi:hypothetical protein
MTLRIADADLGKGELDKYIEMATFVPKEQRTIRQAVVM